MSGQPYPSLQIPHSEDSAIDKLVNIQPMEQAELGARLYCRKRVMTHPRFCVHNKRVGPANAR